MIKGKLRHDQGEIARLLYDRSVKEPSTYVKDREM